MTRAALRLWKDSPAVRTGVSISMATGVYVASFGASDAASLLTVWQTGVLSLLLFPGGAQFAYIDVSPVAAPAQRR